MGTRPFSRLPEYFGSLEHRIDRALKRTMHEAALEADRVAVRETPVRTGLARSNWIATLGSPSAGVIPPYKPGPASPKRANSGKGERANAGGARKQAEQVIRTWTPSDPRPIYITNNVDYIEQINFGGPTNSANNMLAKAVQAATTKIGSVFRQTFKASGIDRIFR